MSERALMLRIEKLFLYLKLWCVMIFYIHIKEDTPVRSYTKASRDAKANQREMNNLLTAYEAACEAMVLLKNDGTLPLQTRKVALYGAGASMTIKGGTGSGEVNERRSINILDGLLDRGFEVTTTGWIDAFGSNYTKAAEEYKIEKRKRINLLKPNSIMEMLKDDFRLPAGPEITPDHVAASRTDSCIYVVSRQAGEGGDRKAEKGDFFLTDEEVKAIRFCAEHYEHFVLVINAGSAIDMSFADQIPGINAIVYICQLGTEGGHAFADLISGAVTPCGKLTDTWAKNYADIPFANEFSYLNGNLKEEYYKEGIYVGYRYFDTFGVEPAYPFGFGLSYTDFSVNDVNVTLDGSAVSVSASVTNTGSDYAGKEVLQLYVSAPEGEMPKEYQSLAAFGKTSLLAPGQTEVLTLSFDLGKIASYREADACFVLESGDYILRLGNSSRNTEIAGVLTLDREVIVSQHQNICPVKSAFEELSAPKRVPSQIPSGIVTIAVDPNAIETVTYSYGAPDACQDARVQTFMNGLSVQDMVEIVVGIGMFGGKKRFDLPGSVGNTTSKFWDRGLANVVLCDGPAGLRIQKISTVDKSGRIKAVEMAMSIFDAFPNFVKKIMAGDPEKETPLYQYATAFPVTNALAQSWNTALMERVGKAVYEEMKEFGCTYWLAPAINIHRNPLCGRNFEYFSEDPYLAGTMATAITKGVQQEEGYYVTVKHFACNNQEDNRMNVSSNVSERALREIYLRGFERCVREGHAKGIMTSYNRVNKVYAPNSYDLCTKVLRNEWGFDGVVMTDWFSTKGKGGRNALAMQAGNDLIMPGMGGNKKDILNGVRTGVISEEDVRRCCGNVIRAILNSATQREYIG